MEKGLSSLIRPQLPFLAETTGGPIPYVCPGSSGPVSRAIHLARINAGWPGCDRCDWRDDTEGLARQTMAHVSRIREQRTEGVRRTEFGVRGQHINRLDRRLAWRLTQAFCEYFAGNGHGDARTLSAVPADQAVRARIAPVIAGFDGRSSSPDIFVGVTSAIREFGMDLIDLGRSTAAALSEAVRGRADAAGGILVTGAGMPPSFTGIDAFDRHGDPVPVVWQNHGFDLTSVSSPSPSSAAGHGGASAGCGTAVPRPTTMLTVAGGSCDRPPDRRMSRQFGAHHIMSFEEVYRSWLGRWYPRRSSVRVVVCTEDPLVRERIRWLVETNELDAVCRSQDGGPDPADTTCRMVIDEDDRSFRIGEGRGNFWSAAQLADRLNLLLRHETSHLTAHADEGSSRFWLTDAGRPASGFPTEQIRDALATLGLLLKLTQGAGLRPCDRAAP